MVYKRSQFVLVGAGLLFLFTGHLSASALASAVSFPDVSSDHKNYEAIEYLDTKEIINGYEDGTFGPTNLVNRAEAIKMIVGALKIKKEDSYSTMFPDVKKEDWFFNFVMAGQKAGVINGYNDGKFKPGDSVNLAETLKMLFAAAKVELPVVSGDVFVDVKKDSWFAPYMLFARDNNIILSDDYGYVHPDQAMSRAYFAEVVYRTMIMVESGNKPFPLNKSWQNFASKNLPFKMKYDGERFQVSENDQEVVFFKPDKEFLQFSPNRIYPNSAVVRLSLDTNDLNTSKTQYFTNIKSAFNGAIFKESKLFDLNVLEMTYADKAIKDWYIYLINGDVLVIYTEHGKGALDYQMEKYIQAMLDSIELTELKNNKKDYTQLLSEIFANILVEGKGMEMLNKIEDKIIIETDSIGVGTGPVDYYHTKELGYTFKYERSTDVILDKREGQTSAF